MPDSFRACAVIPTYNNPKTVGAVVETVGASLPVIVVNDGGDAEARAVLVDLGERGLADVVHRASNGGKGAAVRDGLEHALKQGYTHALQVDADGQHDLNDVSRLLELSRAEPTALVLGTPVFDTSVPRLRLYAREITTQLVHFETGSRMIKDPMCGFRCYPLEAAVAAARRCGSGMDFDPEIAVRLVRDGLPVKNLPTQVIYPENGVSHFRMLTDNVLISWMHTRLISRRLLPVFAVASALLIAYLLAWPVAIEPEAWSAPEYDAKHWSPTPPTGAHRFELGDGYGPEDIDVDDQGRIVVGLHDGRIVRFAPDGSNAVTLANTGGRPLGLDWDGQGRLLIADAWKGLLRLGTGGQLETLTTECGGRTLWFTDDVEVAADGGVWFSDATVRFHQPEWKLDLIEGTAAGRLCRWDPTTGTTREVLKDLYFANGIALDPKEEFVLIAETSRLRVQKYFLSGPKKGTTEIFIDNLPGFPDGISTGKNGLFWLAIASPRNPVLDATGSYPWLRKLLARLPAALQPAPERTTRVLGLDRDGQVKHDYFASDASPIAIVTSVQERSGVLYLGSLVDTAFGTIQPN